MKKSFKISPFILTIILSLLVLGFGCSEDFFNEKAGDRITPDQHYKTLVDAGVSLQGTIIPLQDFMPNLIMLDGLLSDMMDVTANANGNLININDHQVSAGNPYLNPASLYKVIVNANEVLANIDKVAANDRNFDVLVLKAYKGALIGMRSWTYLTLARLYGQAAYLEDNLTSLPSNLNQKMLTKEVLLDTLINQLKPYIHDNSTGPQLEELRLSHCVNNKALLGEIYLEKNDYANAAFYLKLACESYLNTAAILKVDKTYKDAGWSNIFLNAEGNNVENIAVIPYSTENKQDNVLPYWIGHNYLYLVKPTSLLVDSFLAQVPAAGNPGDLYRGNGITFGIDTLLQINDSTFLTESYITKYEIDWQDPLSSDIIISRAADVHLLLAEALNRLGDETSQKYAMMLLNDGVNKINPKPPVYSRWAANLGVRGRVYLKAWEISEGLLRDQVARTEFIEDRIMDERAKELAFEGKRWFDLMRVANRRGDPSYLAKKVAAKFGSPESAKYNEIYNRLNVDPKSWYLPF